MSIWTPTLDPHIPRYRALADALARDIQAGQLKPGERLPTHRDLADALGVTVGTISRGYAEAERRGLTQGIVGRGTFIRNNNKWDPWPDPNLASEIIDLSLSLPVALPEEETLLAATLSQIAKGSKLSTLLAYHPETGIPEHLAIAAQWLRQIGLTPRPENLLVTAGNQHGLNVAMSSLFHPGQVILTGELSYPSLKNQARTFGLKLRSVTLDDEGLCPEALIKAIQQEPRPSGIYVDPTLQNPTSGLLSPSRRQVLADLAATHNLWLLEDDVHTWLLPEPPPPLAAYAPERTVYLSSIAKCLVPGLRTGFIVAPPALQVKLRSAIHNSMWMAAPLMVALTTRWLADGTAERLMKAKRAEVVWRQKLAQDVLGTHSLRSNPYGYQLWLNLPEPWVADAFVAAALGQGVKVIGAGAFAINRSDIPHAVRLSIGVPSRQNLARALRKLDALLRDPSIATY